ncbi:MAG TPA: HAD hydrolase family protein [Gemmataceae bacterium]|nr:HAD hydrolase family protein [Gemmataceae bacterium]
MDDSSPQQPAPGSDAVPPELADRCAAVEMLVLDVDGVLTDGGIIYSDEGVELKRFHVRDGSGLKLWQQMGKRSAVLTGRTSRVVDIRAAEVGITRVIQGAANKLTAYRQLLAESGVRPEQVCFIGDDIPDLPVLRHCGLAVAVADACAEVLAEAHYVTRAPGGRGAVRETIELILRCQGRWQAIVERLRSERL